MCCARSRPISRIAKIRTYIFQEIMMCSRCIKSTQYPFTCSTLSAYVSVCVCVFYENRSSQIFYSWWNFKRLPNWDTRFTLSFVCLSLTYYVMSLTSMEDEKKRKKGKKRKKNEKKNSMKYSRDFFKEFPFFSFMKSAFWTGWSIDSAHI